MLTLKEALEDRERQEVEFKESLSQTTAGAKALVGFANSRGGQVFFGVTDAGHVKGVQVGAGTIEKLAATLDMHVYPSLPLEIDEFEAENGKRAIRVWTPADRPPIVGGYVYSERPIGPDDRVDVAEAQAYRRVGRQTQKIDFMWLRGLLATDPLVMIDSRGDPRALDQQLVLRFGVWHLSGGPAIGVRVGTDPPAGATTDIGGDLPRGGPTLVEEHLVFDFGQLNASIPWSERERSRTGSLWLVARYRDEWTCEWESRRLVRLELLREELSRWHVGDRELFLGIPTPRTWSTPVVRRRLTSLPPKRLAWPAES